MEVMSVSPPVRHVPVRPVMRRPSQLDPTAGTWAVIGAGDHGTAVAAALTAAGIPTLRYDRSTSARSTSAEPSRPTAAELIGHEVIAIEEIEDIEALAITSRDVTTDEITTEYVSGVVICTGRYDDWSFIDPDTLNVVDGHPVLAHRMFTPRHPAIVISGPDVTAGLQQQADVIAAYAATLAAEPRRALAFHRRACARLLPGYPRVVVDPVADQDYESVLDRDLASLTT